MLEILKTCSLVASVLNSQCFLIPEKLWLIREPRKVRFIWVMAAVRPEQRHVLPSFLQSANLDSLSTLKIFSLLKAM